MGAGISLFRWHRKKRRSVQDSNGQCTQVVNPPVSLASSQSTGSPVAHMVENVYEVQDVTNEQFNDHIQPTGLTLIADHLSPQNTHKLRLLNLQEVTPRPDDDLHSGVPDTPVDFEASIYKYYCPLCMLHYKRILKSKCCNNYICLSCCMDYLNRKGIERKDDIASTLKAQETKLQKIHCPNCSTLGFLPYIVDLDDIVRDYSRDNEQQRLISLKSIPSYYQASPVRRGESFEDLKRKMIPYNSTKIVGIADVATPVSIDNNSNNNDDPNKQQLEDADADEPVVGVIRRLDFDDNTNDSNYNSNNSNVSGSEGRTSEMNSLATSMVNGIFEHVVHK